MRNAQNADTDFFFKLVSVFAPDKLWPKDTNVALEWNH